MLVLVSLRDQNDAFFLPSIELKLYREWKRMLRSDEQCFLSLQDLKMLRSHGQSKCAEEKTSLFPSEEMDLTIGVSGDEMGSFPAIGP